MSDNGGDDAGGEGADAAAGAATVSATVRAATDDDLPRLLAVQAGAFPDPHRTLLRSGVRAGLALVAVEEGIDPGAGAGAVADEVAGYVLFTVDGDAVYVAELAVAPGYRRRGHGRRLLAAVGARHPGCARLRLTTRVDNEAARSFYAALGFREVRRLPDYYGGEAPGDPPRADGVLLVRDLE